VLTLQQDIAFFEPCLVSMTNTQSKFVNKSSSKPAKRVLQAPIPLKRSDVKELQKNEYQTFKLRQNPGDADSPTYELTVPLFQTGTPEEYLTFIRDVRHVIEKQNITTGPGRYSLIRTLLRGDALAAFNAAATGEGNETC
jgi:hypothetical protein